MEWVWCGCLLKKVLLLFKYCDLKLGVIWSGCGKLLNWIVGKNCDCFLIE